MGFEHLVESVGTQFGLDLSQVDHRCLLPDSNVRLLVNQCPIENAIPKRCRDLDISIHQVPLRKDVVVVDLLLENHAGRYAIAGVEVPSLASKNEGNASPINAPLPRCRLSKHIRLKREALDTLGLVASREPVRELRVVLDCLRVRGVLVRLTEHRAPEPPLRQRACRCGRSR